MFVGFNGNTKQSRIVESPVEPFVTQLLYIEANFALVSARLQ